MADTALKGEYCWWSRGRGRETTHCRLSGKESFVPSSTRLMGAIRNFRPRKPVDKYLPRRLLIGRLQLRSADLVGPLNGTHTNAWREITSTFRGEFDGYLERICVEYNLGTV
jgi:hypothetical protein